MLETILRWAIATFMVGFPMVLAWWIGLDMGVRRERRRRRRAAGARWSRGAL